jgi:hypothetical protein
MKKKYAKYKGTTPVMKGQNIGDRPRPRDNFKKKVGRGAAAAITLICIL